jgi:hypothetical protein
LKPAKSMQVQRFRFRDDGHDGASKKCVSELNALLKEYGRAPTKSPINDEAAIGDDPESRGDPYVGSAK